MAQYATDEAGNVWDVSNPSAPVFVRAGSQQPITIGTPDPAAQYEAPRKAVELEAARATLARTAASAPYEARKDAADATKAEAEAIKAQRDLEAQQATANPQQQKMMSALGNDEILAAIQKARADINSGGSAGYWARLGKIPVLGNMVEPQGAIDLAGSLNTIASRLTLDKLAQLKQASPTGASGLGSLTEKEGALLRDSVAGLEQTQSPERLLDNLAAVEKHYRNFMALANGEDYRNPKIAEKYGIAAAPSGQQEQPNALAQGAYRDEADPALKGVNNRIRSMIGSGRNANEIVAFMNSVRPGLGTEKARDVLAAVQFRAQNPKVPLSDYAVSVENRSVPMTQARQTLNTLAQAPFGAYGTAAFNALTANNAARLSDNPTLARAGIDAIAEDNPVSSFLGTATGGAMAGAGIEAALPFRAAGAAVQALRQPVADAVYGATASASDGGSALGGATEGVLGGMVGRIGTRALGAGLQGVRNPDAQLLRARGVTMTPGQMLAGEGRFGRVMKGREDRLAGFNGIGDSIKDQQRRSLIDMNRAAFNEAVPPTAQNAIGGYAEQGIEQLQQETTDAYGRALSGRMFDLSEPQLQQDVIGAVQQGMAIPRTGPEFAHAVQSRIDPVMTAGTATGPQMQDVLQGLRDADFGTDAMGNAAADAAGNVRSAFTGMIDRQAPDAMPLLREADQSYRQLNILADAVGRGMNNEGIFTGAQLGQAARANAKRFNGPIAAATTRRPFYDLQRAAQNILPSKVPDSGTAGRMEANGGLFSSMRSGARNLINAPLYSDGLQPVIGAALMDRTPAMIQAGEAIARRARLGGLFGAPLLVDYGP